MSNAFFCDLDQTMIFSKRVVNNHMDTFNGLVVVETYQGLPSAFMTLEASKVLQDLSKDINFIPCSTRSPEQYERVHLPDVGIKYTILDNGGTILVNGREDKEWDSQLRKVVTEVSMDPNEVFAEITAKYGDEEWFDRIKITSDMFVAVIGHESIPAHFIEYVESRLPVWNYRYSVQSRSIYMIPITVTKENAAAEIASRVGATATFGAGDSQLDLGLLRWADNAIRPAHGELYDLKTAEDIRVTTKSGPAAGEQILEFVRLVTTY